MKKRTFAPAPGLPLPDFSNKSAEVVPVATHVTVEDAPVASPPSTPLISEVVVELSNQSGRDMRIISVDLIDVNPLAPREIYTPAMISDRAENLRTQKQHDPIHVIPNPEAPGRFIIADGWTRVQACRIHGVLPALLAEVHHHLTVREAAWFGYEQNEGREGHCDLDRAQFYEKMINDGDTPTEIARRTNLSKSLLSFYRSYAKLPEDVLEIVREHPNKFSANVAYHLAKVFEKCGAKKAVALASKFAAEEQTVRWLINQAQSFISPSNHKTIAPMKHIRYGNGYYKQRGDGFEVSIHSVPAEKREQFAEALEELLDTVAIQVAEPPSAPHEAPSD